MPAQAGMPFFISPMALVFATALARVITRCGAARCRVGSANRIITIPVAGISRGVTCIAIDLVSGIAHWCLAAHIDVGAVRRIFFRIVAVATTGKQNNKSKC